MRGVDGLAVGIHLDHDRPGSGAQLHQSHGQRRAARMGQRLPGQHQQGREQNGLKATEGAS